MSATIPMYCETCQQFYPCSFMRVGGGGTIVVGDSVITNCPLGHQARFLEASYTSTQPDVLEVFNPSAKSKEIFARARQIAEEARAGTRDKGEAIEAIKALIPEAAPIISLWQSNNRWSIYVIIAMIIWMLRSCDVDSSNSGDTYHFEQHNHYYSADGREYRESEKLSKRKARRVNPRDLKPKSGKH